MVLPFIIKRKEQRIKPRQTNLKIGFIDIGPPSKEQESLMPSFSTTKRLPDGRNNKAALNRLAPLQTKLAKPLSPLKFSQGLFLPELGRLLEKKPSRMTHQPRTKLPLQTTCVINSTPSTVLGETTLMELSRFSAIILAVVVKRW